MNGNKARAAAEVKASLIALLQKRGGVVFTPQRQQFGGARGARYPNDKFDAKDSKDSKSSGAGVMTGCPATAAAGTAAAASAASSAAPVRPQPYMCDPNALVKFDNADACVLVYGNTDTDAKPLLPPRADQLYRNRLGATVEARQMSTLHAAFVLGDVSKDPATNMPFGWVTGLQRIEHTCLLGAVTHTRTDVLTAAVERRRKHIAADATKAYAVEYNGAPKEDVVAVLRGAGIDGVSAAWTHYPAPWEHGETTVLDVKQPSGSGSGASGGGGAGADQKHTVSASAAAPAPASAAAAPPVNPVAGAPANAPLIGAARRRYSRTRAYRMGYESTVLQVVNGRPVRPH